MASAHRHLPVVQHAMPTIRLLANRKGRFDLGETAALPAGNFGAIRLLRIRRYGQVAATPALADQAPDKLHVAA